MLFIEIIFHKIHIKLFVFRIKHGNVYIKKPFTDTPNYDSRAFDKPFSFGYNVLLENCSNRFEICERIIRHLWKNEPLLATTPYNVPWGYEKYAI